MIKAEKRQSLQIITRLWRFIWRKRTAYAAGAFIVLFYFVEDVRGWWAWRQAKARLEKRGEKVDFADFIPKAQVPDDQNVFKHPFMQEYGVRRNWKEKTKELNWFNPGFIGHGLEVGPPIPLATLMKLPHQPQVPVSLVSLDPKLAKAESMSAVSFTNAPLAAAAQALARQAEIKFDVDWEKEPFVTRSNYWDAATQRQVSTNKPTEISFYRTNSTPAAALAALFNEHHLQPERDTASGSYRLTPIFTSLAELMERLTRDDAQLRQFEEAIQRPTTQLDWNEETPLIELPMVNFVLLRTAAQGLATRSKIHLLQGRPDAALRDLMLEHRIANFAGSNPGLVGAMIKTAIEGVRAGSFEESLAAGLWPATHLALVQKEFAEINLLTPWSNAMQRERALPIEAIRRLASPWKYPNPGVDFIRLLNMSRLVGPLVGQLSLPEPTFPHKCFAAVMLAPPRGWFYQNMVHFAEAPVYRTALTPAPPRIDVSQVKELYGQMDAWCKGRSPYTILANFALPNFIKSQTVMAKNQTLVNEAFIACALERHRAAKGVYPDKLETLVPEFATKLPHDLFDGQPLRYRRTGDGKYLLYSIGWNSIDDGGVVDESKDAKFNANWSDDQGDWVWQGVPKQP